MNTSTDDMKKSNARRALIVICLMNLCVMMYMVTATVIGYIIASFHDVSQTRILLLLTIPALVALVVNILAGVLVQKVSKKALVILALCCHFAAMMIFFLSRGKNLQILYIGAVLAGVTQGSTNTLCGAIIADYVEPQERSGYIAKSQIFLNVGGIIWNMIGGALASGNNGAHWYNAYALGFVLPIIIIVIFAVYPKGPTLQAAAPGGDMPPMEGMDHSVPADGKIPGKVFSVALLFSLFSVFMYAFNLYISDYYINVLKLGSSAQVGIIQTCMTVAGMVIGFFYGGIFKKLKNKIVCIMMAVTGIGLLLIANIHSMTGFVIGAACLGIGYLPVFSYMMAYVTNITPVKKTGLALALFNGMSQVFMFLGQYIINAVSGIFCDTSDLNAYMYSRFTVSGIMCVVLGIIALFVFAGNKKAQN